MVSSSDGPKHQGAGVRLAGPVQTLLQLTVCFLISVARRLLTAYVYGSHWNQAVADCVTDLLAPFRGDTIDLVAGIDAMGFILGASIATTLAKGFLAIRKAGHLGVETQSQNYSDYTGRKKTMEVRLDVLRPGLKVLLVDQWIETGGTMRAAIQLVEQQRATVVGVAAVAIENTEGGKWIKENYKFSHCVPEELQNQIDSKDLQCIKISN